MRTVKINAILLLLIIVCACCSTAGAKEKKITKQIIKMAPREEIQTSGMWKSIMAKAMEWESV